MNKLHILVALSLTAPYAAIAQIDSTPMDTGAMTPHGAASAPAPSTSDPSASSASSAASAPGEASPSSTQAWPSTMPASGASPAAALSAPDLAFLRDAADAGLAEVQASQLAETQATDPDVKSFAKKMVEDHTQANAQLAELAQAKGVTLPSELSAAAKRDLAALKALRGAKFDTRYMAEYGPKAHISAVSKFRKQAESGQDSDLKTFATQTLPVLENHLKHASALQEHRKAR